MDCKILKYSDRFESSCTDADGTVWHTATWGLDCDPSMIKRESLLLAEYAKAKATEEPEEIVLEEVLNRKLIR